MENTSVAACPSYSLPKQRVTWRRFKWAAAPALVFLAIGMIFAADADASENESAADGRPIAAGKSEWELGGFVDAAYLLNFNFPPNHTFRSRSTTTRVNELDLNMAGVFFKKDTDVSSPWGAELLVQTGEDAKEFGFANNTPKVGSSDQLRHFGRANVSYLAPVGSGLRVQAGLFNSFIGYESLYSKDNVNYTRAWISDNSPYLMFGVNASYPITHELTGTVFVINGYAHLAHANDVPSYGAQLAWKGASRFSFQQTVYYGPDQSQTDINFWRLFSDSIAKYEDGPVTVGFDYQIGTERMAGLPGNPRVFWTGASMPIQWHVNGPWSVAIRPEFYWDRNGRLTGSEQFVKAVTATVEHRLPVRLGETILRLEYRFDESTGSQGGFFTDATTSSGSVGLTPSQQLVIFSAVWTFTARPWAAGL